MAPHALVHVPPKVSPRKAENKCLFVTLVLVVVVVTCHFQLRTVTWLRMHALCNLK